MVHYGGTLLKEISVKYIGGKVTYWNVDLGKWSYLKVGAIKDVGYIEVKELFYSIETLLHKLYDDKDVMNMIKVVQIEPEVHIDVDVDKGVDQGVVGEGLIDVDVDIDIDVHNNVEGSVEVEADVNA
ncbi:hypothetical protein LR48_Vigan846s000500 [Vigna angularis]|uniref:PB1-like domain-containing protein n=1 Tax=Phaseolus angularis TaxID=3914 RepID=A0A0L9THV2_PHAAN|nr:hypothetical protein LR48_Vigan846s000500 [Vigna angularis]